MKFLNKYMDIFIINMIAVLCFGAGYLTCNINYLNLKKYKPIDQVMRESMMHDYNIDTYNCVDFSKDAQKKLKEKGIGSTIIVGHRNGDPVTHAFIGVWIDPQTGEFVNDYNFYGTIKP